VVVSIKVAFELIELQGRCWRVAKKAFDEAYAAPTRLGYETLVHERGGNPSDENSLRLTVNKVDGKVYGFGDLLILKGEQSCYVNTAPKNTVC